MRAGAEEVLRDQAGERRGKPGLDGDHQGDLQLPGPDPAGLPTAVPRPTNRPATALGGLAEP
ncbi:hypothetical protein GCM10009848_49180 [Micromonospora lupini]